MIADTFVVCCPGCEQRYDIGENEVVECCDCRLSVDSHGDAVVDLDFVLCPHCEEPCAVGDRSELQCPSCQCRFCVDATGDVEDEQEINEDSNLEVDELGELCDDTSLRQLRCPRCSRTVEVGEPGDVTCPHCQRVFEATWAPRVPEWLTWPEAFLWEDYEPYEYEGGGSDEYCPHCQIEWDGCAEPILTLRPGFFECSACGATEYDLELCEDIAEEEGVDPTDAYQRCVLACDDSGDIQNDLRFAVGSTGEGGTVILRPGTYKGIGTIHARKLKLVAEGPPGSVVIQGNLDIEGSRLRFEGITFRGPMKIHHGKVRFRNCVFGADDAGGVQVSGGTSRVLFEDCRFEDVPGVALTTYYGTCVRMTRCKMTNNEGGGIWVDTGGWLRLRECEIVNNGSTGVSGRRGSRVFLHGCQVRDNKGDGIAITGGQAIVRKCQVTGHEIGIKFGAGTRGAILSCQVTDNQVGLQLEERSRTYTKDTTIKDNQVGIVLQSRAKVRTVRCSVEGNRGENWDVAEGGCVMSPGVTVRT